MRTPKFLFGLALTLLAPLFAASAGAQGLTVQIVNGVPSAIPITVVPFGQQGSGPASPVDVAQIISMDLDRCGKFRTLPTSEIVQSPTTGSQIQFATWQQLKQDYITVGTTSYTGGVLTANFELWDVNKQQMLLKNSVSMQGSDLRRVAHQIADQIYQKIIGQRGAFDTRIAYVTMVGLGKNAQYSLVVADSDGFNPQTVVQSHEALLSPAWSPNGQELAYVSFESGNSAIYIQNVATGARKVVSARPGINGAPRFSPDGKKLAVCLSFQGNPEIYVVDLATGALTRITHNLAIDTEPRWTPGGHNLIFTSDRTGMPQLYEIPATGGVPQRITFQGQYNADASLDYNGNKIAMVQGNGNVYRIAVMDRTHGGQETFVSPGNLDDSPSWAPNSSMLLYSAEEGSKSVLYSVSSDGRVRQRLMLAGGDVQSPAWGPYRKP